MACEVGGFDVAYGDACDDGEVDAPDVEADVAVFVETGCEAWGVSLGGECAEQGEYEHDDYVAQEHEHGGDEADVCVFFYYGEEGGDDNHGDDVGDDGEGGERAYAASEFFGYDDDGGGCGADEADEHAFEHELGIGGSGAKEEYEAYHGEAEGDAGGLYDEVPCAGLELAEVDLAECEIEYGKHSYGEVVCHEGGEGGCGGGE